MTTREPGAAPFCSLDAENLRERIEMLRREILPHAQESRALSPGRAWEFADTPTTRTRLEHFVALERECCRGAVTFHLEEDAARGVLRLELRGLDPLDLLGPGAGARVGT